MYNRNYTLSLANKCQKVHLQLISNRVAPVWNALFLITKTAPTINKFKELLEFDYDAQFVQENGSMFKQTKLNSITTKDGV